MTKDSFDAESPGTTLVFIMHQAIPAVPITPSPHPTGATAEHLLTL